jgi:hypothetical protein
MALDSRVLPSLAVIRDIFPRRAALALLALAAVPLLPLLGVGPARSADNDLWNDAGTYRVYQRQRPLGREEFEFMVRTDSLLVFSHVFEELPRGDSVDSLVKHAALMLAVVDEDLRDYQSIQHLNGHRTKRYLAVDDTLFTSYREDGNRGVGERLVRPPGRLYILDPQVFVLFDYLCRSLHQAGYVDRPISLLLLASRDTVIEAQVTDTGVDTLRWGARPVQARKLRIADRASEFFAWVSPSGRMLRLTQPATGLRVERDPPPVAKPRRRTSG